MAKEQIQWASPPPLWPLATNVADAGARRTALRQPAILRFATDTFMNDFADVLDQDPARLVEYLAAPGETWRGQGKKPTPLPPVPLFARTMNRLGLVAARAKDASLIPGGLGVSSLVSTGGAPPKKLKLYQPAHQRFYLVASSLVCERVGLPDHTINVGRHERATFVVRRMFPPGPLDIKVALPPFDATWEEYAFIVTQKGNFWRRIPKPGQTQSATLIGGEEQLPLFPMTYVQDDGRARKLLSGLIPVGKREAYMAAGFQKQDDDPDPVEPIAPEPDARMHLFWSKVTEPWKKLLEQASSNGALTFGSKLPTTVGEPFPTPPTPIPADKLAANLKSMREQIQTGSWYILLDFAILLSEQEPRVWRLLNGQSPEPGDPPFKSDEQALVNAIKAVTFDMVNAAALIDGTKYDVGDIKASLKDALLAVKSNEDNLEKVKTSYDRNDDDPTKELWPLFLFPLADPKFAPPQINPKTTNVDQLLDKVDALASLIEKALPEVPVGDVPTNPLIAQQPMDMREGWYVIRCVFERPECGPIDPPVLSDPSQNFQMAGFFDPDAPARPIRIALPIDTSPAGLRKFDKNTAFMISDMLCGQINRVKGMTLGDLVLSVLPWPFHKDLPVGDGGPCTKGSLEIGMMCSLSIPIITICALLLLMIIVFLLDFIFRWIPFFIFCFPLPKFKSKD